MTRRPQAFLWLLLALTAAAPAGAEPGAPESPQGAAFRGYHVCLIRSIVSLDDGRSDAGTVARAAASVCDVEWVAMVEALKRPMAPAKAKAYEAEAREKRLDTATAFVLKARSTR